MKDLMIKRVRMDYWYPGSSFKEGDILELSNGYYRNQYGSVSIEDVERCQINFSSLDWYEERRENEMPSYLKGDDGAFRVLSHFRGVHKDKVKCFNGSYDTTESYYNLIPATYEEYMELKKFPICTQ